jgi:hypothetical protein
VQEQEGEKCALFSAAECERPAVLGGRKRPENLELDADEAF